MPSTIQRYRIGWVLVVVFMLAFPYDSYGDWTPAPSDADLIVYLPLVTSPPVTERPPPPQPQPVFTIPDGDFEHGGGWFELRALDNRPLIVREAPGFPIQPRSGQWFAWLGGNHLLGETRNHQSRIVAAAPITLPNTQPLALQFYYQMISSDQPNDSGVCDRDVLNVWVASILVAQGQICQQLQTNGWEEARIDLSPLAGRQVIIEFEMRTNYELLSHIFLDDIAIIVGP